MPNKSKLKVVFELLLSTRRHAVITFNSPLEYDVFLNAWRDSRYTHFQLPTSDRGVQLVTVKWESFVGAEVSEVP